MQRQFRLRHGEDFNRVKRQGKEWRHPLMALAVLANGLPHNRFGFITGRRIGKAVVRNRARRQLRESMRQRNERLKTGFDVVVVARSELITRNFSEIDSVLEMLCKRAGLLAADPQPTPNQPDPTTS
jgi:ribonuclease P protein component